LRGLAVCPLNEPEDNKPTARARIEMSTLADGLTEGDRLRLRFALRGGSSDRPWPIEWTGRARVPERVR